MKTVFMYAGQGSQHVGMGKDFYEKSDAYRATFDAKENYKAYQELMENGPEEELKKTENTQPCMAAFAAGVTDALVEKGIKPEGCVGLSLGEYGALYGAGVLSKKDYVDTVAFRGAAMAEAAKGLECSMSAILGLDSAKVTEAVESVTEGYVVLVNYNCPGQYVICGDESAVAAAEEKAKELGAKRAVRLNVSGPFHTKYMAPASVKLREYIDGIEMNKPEVPVAMNVTGDFLGDADTRALLEEQIKSGVHFEDDIKRFLDEGADTFVEIGPGKTLAGFVKKIAKEYGKDVTTFSIDSYEDYEKVVESLA